MYLRVLCGAYLLGEFLAVKLLTVCIYQIFFPKSLIFLIFSSLVNEGFQ